MTSVSISDELAERAMAEAKVSFNGSLDALSEAAIAFYVQVQQAVRRVATASPTALQPTEKQIIDAATSLHEAGHLAAKELAAVKADPIGATKLAPHPVIKSATKANIKATIATGIATIDPAVLDAVQSGLVDAKVDLSANAAAIKAVAPADPVEAAAQAIAASSAGTAEIATLLAQIERVGLRVSELRR